MLPRADKEFFRAEISRLERQDNGPAVAGGERPRNTRIDLRSNAQEIQAEPGDDSAGSLTTGDDQPRDAVVDYSLRKFCEKILA